VNPYFVTLTIPSVYEHQLKGTILGMGNTFRQIKDLFRQQKKRGTIDWVFRGIRNTECSYSPTLNAYHPHFHLIVEGEAAANALVDEWLNRYYSVGALASGQDIRPAKEGSIKELFKYVTKMILKQNGVVSDNRYALDVIYQALYKCRTIQPFNINKDICEDSADLKSQPNEDLSNQSDEPVRYFQWRGSNWVHLDTGEAIPGYIPDEKEQTFAKMVNPNKV
jgi:hypothetical protein